MTEVAAFVLHRESRQVSVAGSAVPLRARAFDVLAYLETHRDRVVSKAELLEQVWGGLTVEEGNLSVQISALRKALGPKAIATVPGVGYKLATGPSPAPASGPALPDIPSLAVLPFANLTGEADREYLVDGIVTDLISALSRVTGLMVISATSSFALKGHATDLSEIGTRLGVRYVLEGAIQQAGDTLRITVQLVEAASGRTLWSDRFRGALQDVFDLQDEITEIVCGVIEPELIVAEAGRVAAMQTTSSAAYDLCLQALPLAIRPLDVETFRRCDALLDRALALDPDYTLAKAWKCHAYMRARGARWLAHDDLRDMQTMAQGLMRDHRNNALVLAFAGFLDGYMTKGREAAITAVRQAQRLNPNSAFVLNSAGWVESYAGHYEEAIHCFERAVRLDPIGHIGAHCRLGWGICEVLAGRPERGTEILEASYAEAAYVGSTVLALVLAYHLLWRDAEAERMAHEALAIVPDFTIKRALAELAFSDPAVVAKTRAAFIAAGLPGPTA